AGEVRRRWAGSSTAVQGKAGMVGRDQVWPCAAWRSRARRGRRGQAWHGAARRGVAWKGRQGLVRLSAAKAGTGTARPEEHKNTTPRGNGAPWNGEGG